MKGSTIGALFIIAIMLLSGIGYLFYGTSSSNQSPPDNSAPSAPAPVQKQFSNPNLQVKVLETFDSLVVLAKTSEITIGKIDAQLSSIPGVAGVSSQYITNQLGPELVYRATIQLAAGTDKQKVADAISTTANLITVSDLFQAAVVELPKKLSVQETGLPSGAEGEQTVIDLESQLSQAYVKMSTEKDDILIVNFQGVFEDKKLVQGGAVELQNISKTPQRSSYESFLTLKSLSLQAVGGASMPFSVVKDENALQQEFGAFKNASGVKVTVPYLNNLLVVNREDMNSLESELQAKLSSDQRISSFQFSPAQLSVDVVPGTDLNELKAFLVKEIESASLVSRDVSFTDPASTQFFVDMNVSSQEFISPLETEYNSLIAKNHFTDSQLFQVGKTDVNEVTVPDTNQVIAIDENASAFDFLVKPGHNIGDMIASNVTFVYAGNKVLGLQATEKVN